MDDAEFIGWTNRKRQIDPNFGGGFLDDDPEVVEEAQRRLREHGDKISAWLETEEGQRYLAVVRETLKKGRNEI